MKEPLQCFALNANGEVVSIHEVERGLACMCVCPACGERLIARKGDVRGWHFAHQSSTEKRSCAETALHRAAKTIVQRHKGITLPAFDLVDASCLESSQTSRAPAWISFDDIDAEIHINDIKPDLLAWSGSQRLAIEIAVTHRVDQDKANKIAAMNLAAIEIRLDPDLKESWTWDDLQQAVLHESNNRHWIHHPVATVPKTQQQTGNTLERQRLIVAGMFVDIRRYPWGITLWSQYSPQLTPHICLLAKRFGGRWKASHKNWVFYA